MTDYSSAFKIFKHC